MSEEIRLPEAFGPPPKPSINPERRKDYEVRLNHQQVVTLLPATMWRTAERLGKLPPQESATVLDTSAIDAQLLKLYYLAQQYTLIPNTDATLQKETELETLAIDCPALDDDALLAKAKLLRTQQDLPPSPDALTTSEHWSTLADDLEPGFAHATELLARQQWLRRLKLRKAILTTLAQPQVRARYQAELQEVRGVQKRPQTRKRLNDLIDTQADRGWAAQTIRSTLVDHYIKQKPLTGVTRDAVKQLGRMVDAAETKEQGIVGAMSLEQRGLLKTTQLLEYKRQLDEHGFVLTKSREALVTEIARLAARGYRIFLGGPTGAGKTNLALFALKEQTDGSFSWITWTGETSVRDLFGSPTLTATADGRIESGMSHGPMTQAVLGVKDGILHEEFTGGQNNVQMSLKTLWASQPGDTVNLPGFNGTQFTKEHLVEIATGNLKGRRHQDREAMDPAVAREFKSLEVTFLPANEQRDIILAMLIDKTGILPLSKVEIELIDQLCKSAELSQRAYLEEIPSDVRSSDYYKVVSPTGDPVTLTKVFLDTGTLMDLFRGWQPTGESLADFLGRGLDNFINKSSHFTELKQEQTTMRNILAAYGFTIIDDNLTFAPLTPPTQERTRPYQRPIDLGDLVAVAPPSTVDPYSTEQPSKSDRTEPETPPSLEKPLPVVNGTRLSPSETMSAALRDAAKRAVSGEIVALTLPRAEAAPAERTLALMDAWREYYKERDGYDEVGPFVDGRAVVKKGKNYWHIKEDGTELTGERYDFAGEFQMGRAIVSRNGESWHIKRNGERLYYENYSDLGNFSEKGNGATNVITKENKAYGVDIDGNLLPDEDLGLSSEEEQAFQAKAEAIYGKNNVGPLILGRAWAVENGSIIYINSKMEKISSERYLEGKDFSEGRALVKGSFGWMFITRDGTALNRIIYEYAESFKDGKAKVQLAGGGTYFIDIDGNQLEDPPSWPPGYDPMTGQKLPAVELQSEPLDLAMLVREYESLQANEAVQYWRDLETRWKAEGKIDTIEPNSYAEGFVVVTKDSKKKLMSLDGDILLGGFVDRVEPFSDGFALFGSMTRVNFIRPIGTLLINVSKNSVTNTFEDARSFKDGRARVKLDGKWKTIDTDGKDVADARSPDQP